MAVPRKPGSKAYRDQLRERLVDLGVDGHQLIEQVVADLLGCGCRPREAWRLACELTQDEVAARFNQIRGDPNIRMRGSRICEYEKWPIGGTRPSVRALKILAAIYETTWDRLVDVDDLEQMPARDRQAFLDISDLHYGDSLGLSLPRQRRHRQLSEALFQALRDLPFADQEPATERRVWNVPPRNANFIGRADELGKIRASLSAGQVMTVQALRGMGGIGKTHTAIEYAHQYATDYEVVWWVEAEQAALIAEQFAALGALLGLPAAPDTTAAVRAVCNDLRRRQAWLLIFDNAERIEDLRPVLPGGTGHVLVTTRRGGFRVLGPVLDLGVFDRANAVTLLHCRAPNLSSDEANALAEALGDLPLALEQAAAFLDQTGLPAAEYLDLLRVRARELYARGRAAGHQDTIATLWSVSFKQLHDVQPNAVHLLDLCAWLAPEPIPLDLVTNHPDRVPEPLASAVADPLALTDIVGVLVDYSLVRRTSGGLLLHRLVQAVSRQSATAQQQRHPLAVDLALLRADLGEDILGAPDNWPRWRQLLPHVLAATDHHDDAQPVAADDVAWLLERAATYLYVVGSGLITGARPLLERALTIRESLYDPNDPQVAATLQSLGTVLSELGQWAAARPRLERALRIQENRYRPDHPDLADTLSSLGGVLARLGDSATARSMLERALNIYEAAYGPHDSRITTTLVFVGSIFMDIGKPAQAQEFFARALRIRESVLGPRHPWTATCLTHLGEALAALGELTTARSLLERGLRIRESAYGADSFIPAGTLVSLGAVLAEMGEPAAARALLERALRIREAVFGPNHLWTAITLNRLGRVLINLGDPAAARPLLIQALHIVETTYGPCHPAASGLRRDAATA